MTAHRAFERSPLHHNGMTDAQLILCHTNLSQRMCPFEDRQGRRHVAKLPAGTRHLSQISYTVHSRPIMEWTPKVRKYGLDIPWERQHRRTSGHRYWT
jgi:hypothetical protein